MASYSTHQDEYPLDILHAAMTSHLSNSYEHRNYASGLTDDPASEISNHHRDVPRNQQNLFDINPGSDPIISNLYNSYDAPALSTPNMGTLAFGSTTGNGRDTYLESSLRARRGSPTSRNHTNGLAILNAETYNSSMLGKNPSGGASNGATWKQSNDPSIPFGLVTPNSAHDSELKKDPTKLPEAEHGSKRKKKRTVEAVSGDDDDDDDGKKKSRGRPRVDTKDETAADRRRTQIRMAQRAYRNRKETTISSLEKKVEDLRDTNEKMSNLFISLYDFAVERGLLQREPELGQKLQSTTQRFLSLARVSSEDMGEKHNDEPELIDPVLEEGEEGPPKKKGKRAFPKHRREPTPPASVPATSPPAIAPWGGYQVEHSEDQYEELTTGFHMQPFDNRSRDLHVITRPTEGNASFPLGFNDDLQNYRVEVPAHDNLSQFFFPQAQPSLPDTYSYTESSFGRRLLRASCERAMSFLSMEDPPEELFNRVFGFPLQYENKEAITARIRELLARSRSTSLQHWKSPFAHVGGAGTFYPFQPLLNDVNEDLMPPFGSGFSQKPFSQRITQAEDMLDAGINCRKPGFEGEFFDANDVEGYLRSRGLEIPDSADTVTAQIDLSVISDTVNPESQSDSSSTRSPTTPESIVDTILGESSRLAAPYTLDAENLDNEAYQLFSASNKWAPSTVTMKDSNIEPSLFSMVGQTFNATSRFERIPNRPTITLNVQVLVTEMVARSVCLGRTPGFRLADVNAAIVAAVRPH